MVRQAYWNSDPVQLQSAIETALGLRIEEYEVRFRPMFGGIMAYAFDRPFASMSTAGLALKLDPSQHEDLASQEGGYPLRYEPGDPPSKSYSVLPESHFGRDLEVLAKWLLISIDHVKALPLKKKKPRKKTTSS